jgi:hypothetical protein
MCVCASAVQGNHCGLVFSSADPFNFSGWSRVRGRCLCMCMCTWLTVAVCGVSVTSVIVENSSPSLSTLSDCAAVDISRLSHDCFKISSPPTLPWCREIRTECAREGWITWSDPSGTVTPHGANQPLRWQCAWSSQPPRYVGSLRAYSIHTAIGLCVHRCLMHPLHGSTLTSLP